MHKQINKQTNKYKKLNNIKNKNKKGCLIVDTKQYYMYNCKDEM